MARHVTRLILRRLGMRVSILFGLFVLADVALFGWLILGSLSQREIERVLLETREEAQPLAQELKERAEHLGLDDLYVVMSVAEDTKSSIDTMLRERKIMETLEIRDKEGTVVYRYSAERPLDDGLDGPDLHLRPGLQTEVEIGELGQLVIGVSEEELQRRIGVLRTDLVQQASVVAVFTATLLGVAMTVILMLFRRADRLEQQALEAERMAYVGTLASGLAHEIRNPLNSLNLNMQMLEEEGRRQGPSSHRLLAITRSEISRLERLVTDFLSYAKPRPLKLVKTTAAELFEPLLELMEEDFKTRGVEVGVEDRSAGVRAGVDPEQVSQLLLNLVQNSLAAVAEGRVRSGRIVLGAENQAGQLLLSVADNGPGIPEGEKTKIFDLFYSTKKGGTGLGLAIVERIAKSHGAELEVVSIPGEGTTVRLRFPKWTDSPRRG